MHKYHSLEEYSFELVKNLRLQALMQELDYIKLGGEKVKCNSVRLQTFFVKGTKCEFCGREGTHFILEKSTKKEPWHMNLYATDKKTGNKVLMTRDHIIPRSLGGSEVLANQRPMCCKCNVKRGNKVTDEDLKKGVFKNVEQFNQKNA